MSVFLTDQDTLKLRGNDQVRAMLRKIGDNNPIAEKVILSTKLTKINRKDKQQQRILLVTNKALYNIRPGRLGSCQRRIMIDIVASITSSTKSHEFTLNIPTEYDYRYKAADTKQKRIIFDVIYRLYGRLTGLKLNIHRVDADTTVEHTVTKTEAKLITHEEKYLRRHKLTASSDMMYNAKKYSEEEIKYAREDFVTPDPSRRNTRETDKLRSDVLGHNPSDKRQNPITGGMTIAPLYEDSPSPLQGHEGYVYRLGDSAKRSSILVIFGYIQHEIESPHNLSIPDKACWLIFDYYYIAMMLYDYKEIGIMTQIEGGALYKIEPLSDGHPNGFCNGFRDTNGFSESHPNKLSSLRMGSSRTGSSRTGSSRTVSWRTDTGSTCTNTTTSSSSKRSRASKRRTVSDSGALKYYEYRTKYMVMEKRSKQYLSEHQNVRYRMLEKRKLLEGVSKHSLFIMKLHYAFQTANDLYLIYNHFPGGSLRSALHRHHTFSEDVARIWIASLSSAIAYLHSYGIFHIDLSLEHVLLDEMGHVHLTNIIPKSFSFKKSDHLSTAKTGYNIAYYAPEIVQNLEYSPSADWWTIGIILYELCTGSTPFYDENIDKMYKRIVNEQFDLESCPNGMSDECKDLIGALLVKDEASRLGAKNDVNQNFVLNHTFFADLNIGKLERKEIDSLYIPVILDDGKMEPVDDGKETFDDLVVGDGDHKIIDFLHFDDFVL